jgi:hypothetical protein
MFVAWMYFSNHIVPSAETRIVAINFALALGNRIPARSSFLQAEGLVALAVACPAVGVTVLSHLPARCFAHTLN